MKKLLQGWGLIEGRVHMTTVPDPKVSDVIAALEAIRPDVIDPFVILEAPDSGDGEYPSYCQAFADDHGYVCEIRIFKAGGFTHSRAFLPDAEGRLGEGDDPQLPCLGQALRIFTGFIADPWALPAVDTVQWLDVSDEFEAVTA